MKHRQSEYPILDVILNRWSSRSMSGESITDKELMTLFEAARWAPSAYNNQPWRFAYTTRDDKDNWNKYLNLMVEFNRSWSKNGAVIILIASNKYFEYNNNYCKTHSFDTGASWQNLALQGYNMGLVVHAIEGFDYEKAKQELNIPEEFNIECMVVVGKSAPKELLSENLQKKEVLSDRKPLHEIVFKNKFNK